MWFGLKNNKALSVGLSCSAHCQSPEISIMLDIFGTHSVLSERLDSIRRLANVTDFTTTFWMELFI